MEVLKNLIKSIRPHQWVKNVFIFTALIFSEHLFDMMYLWNTFGAFAIFSFVSGAVYIFNDIVDYEKDKVHPVKALRPIASDQLNRKTAFIFGLLILILSLYAAFTIQIGFLFILLIYLLINFLYTIKLKEIILIDVFSIASGFILRVVSGAVIINVPISRWFIVCTLALALFLGFAKRRHEVVLLGKAGTGHRLVLAEYSRRYLDQIITILSTSIIVSYLLYTIDPDTIYKFGTDRLIFTSIFVFYGVFRYMYLIDKNRGTGDPSKVVFTDPGIAISVALWFISSIALIYKYIDF